jgi:stage IV sporulation protein B
MLGIIIFCFLYIQALCSIPDQLLIFNGEDYAFDYNSIIPIKLVPDQKVDLKVNKGSSSFVLRGNKNEKVKLAINLLGLIPLKTMVVEAVPRIRVIPCGNTIGIKIYTKGALVVGQSQVIGIDGRTHEPYRISDIRPGDYFLEINNKKVKNIQDITGIMKQSTGQSLNIKINRSGSIINKNITPIKSYSDNKYKIGLWLRDSTVGIGTMTFYDQSSRVFGALGHGITDIDTGTLMEVGKGEILRSNVISIKKGFRGSPGELRGSFLESRKQLGDVFENTTSGIYGIVNDSQNIVPKNKPMPIALKSEVKEGPAQILCNISGNSVEAYNIIIQKLFRQSVNTSKSMVIKITDQRLLNYTGGIVQGMSGSPIIQDGKIVGAVTHVLVNDPSRGYGIFIENMIQKIQEATDRSLENAG